MRTDEEARPLARSLIELRVLGVFMLFWGCLGLAGLVVLEDPGDVLVGHMLAVVILLAVWIPLASRAALRRRRRAGARTLPASPHARREQASETIRLALAGRARMLPVFVLLLLLPSVLSEPGPRDAGVVAGAVMGTLTASGLENLRRAVRLARWQRQHRQTVLFERPSRRPRLRPAPRRVFTEPSGERGRPATSGDGEG